MYSSMAAARASCPRPVRIVADILDAAKHFEFLKGWGWEDEIPGQVLPQEVLETAYFIRIKGSEEDILSVYGSAQILFAQDGVTAAITPVLCNAEHSKNFAQMKLLSAIRVLEV